MTTPEGLVEHFFRHEYGRIVAILVRSLGTRNLELAEDVVQAAMERALRAWSHSPLPDQPAAWLLQTARRLAIDAIRQQQTDVRYRAREGSQLLAGSSCGDEQAAVLFPGEIGDEPLRLLFLCCHPGVAPEAGLALALKTVAGFSVREIAAALLTSEEAVQKRIERARQRMQELNLELESLRHPWMLKRLESVLSAIYLLFNEGHFSSQDEHPIRRDLCNEALRLVRLLAEHPVGDRPQTQALRALLCFHSARLDARVGDSGTLVLLGDQKREQWDWALVREGMQAMACSASGELLSRYHLEAAIAWEHCRAASEQATDWPRVLSLYQQLEQVVPGPAVTLNLAIAEARVHGPRVALERLESHRRSGLPQPYPLWDAVTGTLWMLAGDLQQARFWLQQALRNTTSPASRSLLESRLAECGGPEIEGSSGSGPALQTPSG